MILSIAPILSLIPHHGSAQRECPFHSNLELLMSLVNVMLVSYLLFLPTTNKQRKDASLWLEERKVLLLLQSFLIAVHSFLIYGFPIMEGYK